MSVIALSEKHYNSVFYTLTYARDVYPKVEGRHLEEMMQTLHRLNHQSYDKRYREKNDLPDYEPKEHPATYLQPVELYKALQCILYQIEYEPENLAKAGDHRGAKWLQTARNMMHGMAARIISDSIPAYQAAQWTIA